MKFVTKKDVQNTKFTHLNTNCHSSDVVYFVVLTFVSLFRTGMALGYPPPSPVGQYAPLTPINMSAGIDLSSSGGGGSYSPPHNLSPKGSSSANVNGYNSQVMLSQYTLTCLLSTYMPFHQCFCGTSLLWTPSDGLKCPD